MPEDIPPLREPIRESTLSFVVKIAFLQFLVALLVATAIAVAFYFFPPSEASNLLLASLIILSVFVQTLDAALLTQLVLRWSSTTYTISPGEVTVTRGINNARATLYKASNAEAIEVRQSPLGRLFNYGTISFYNPTIGSRIELPNVPNPWFYVNVIARKDQSGAGGRPQQAS